MFIKTLANFETSWEALKAAVADGSIGKVLHSGDKVPVTLKTGEEVVFEVTYDESGKLFFMLRDCLDDEYDMRYLISDDPDDKSYAIASKNTRPNRKGWQTTAMRRHLNKTVFSLLPDDLQAAIVPTKIVQIINGERVECEDKLFLPSKTQVFGKGDWTEFEPEDTQFDIFTHERDRVKECGKNGTWFWWLRSPVSSSSTYFCNVYYDGNSASNYANNSHGVAFGFCI